MLIVFHHQHRDGYRPPREPRWDIEWVICFAGMAIFAAVMYLTKR